MVVSAGNSFGKTICSICYEDLKPIVEDLQSISICGHVFHELCLQQWFEYCSNEKKYSCPVCKQRCTATNVCRLYFQSVGDQNDAVNTQREQDPDILRDQVKRLEVKVSGLTSYLELRGKEIIEINEELCLCKEKVKNEVALKNEALRQKISIQQLLNSKSEELDKLTIECLRLQERNMALAKELAALKLVSDLNLEEGEVLKFASLGNEANTKDTIDILRKSLVIRNKNYKELMAKCNLLGRGEARASKNLEKAKEKINKLKARVQQLDTAVEVKDNKDLRALKASKKASCKGDIQDGNNGGLNSLPEHYSLPESRTEQLSIPSNNWDQTRSLINDRSHSRKAEEDNYNNDKGANYTKKPTSNMAQYKERDAQFLVDGAAVKFSTAVQGLSNPDFKHQTRVKGTHQCTAPTSEAIYDINGEAEKQETGNLDGLGSRIAVNSDKGSTAAMEKDVILLSDDIEEVQPKLNTKKESSSPFPLSKPADICFSGGLIGPDGTTRYLGKWCKRGQGDGSVAMQGSNASSGDLIAIGADGRGGRIKVLRSLNQYSQDGQEASVSAKRFKYGAKTSNLQTQGCLQIEHFFGRDRH
ncbi:zf-RING_2 domain-containing protein [Cephalotus follicularis]|uniref:Zf-RING_2 domain-containing protein n=1 Tax=Cephalotus follicularis TaxID=3775 RepID=A0A1Q3CZI8_CEPFO|nr:zf-RING_2 domain-containing protein [Cephalotus follicularis]